MVFLNELYTTILIKCKEKLQLNNIYGTFSILNYIMWYHVIVYFLCIYLFILKTLLSNFNWKTSLINKTKKKE